MKLVLRAFDWWALVVSGRSSSVVGEQSAGGGAGPPDMDPAVAPAALCLVGLTHPTLSVHSSHISPDSLNHVRHLPRPQQIRLRLDVQAWLFPPVRPRAALDAVPKVSQARSLDLPMHRPEGVQGPANANPDAQEARAQAQARRGHPARRRDRPKVSLEHSSCAMLPRRSLADTLTDSQGGHSCCDPGRQRGQAAGFQD